MIELNAYFMFQELVNGFNVPNCPKCQKGILKPDVVFFGDNVPQDRVKRVQEEVKKSSSILVIGSSLQVSKVKSRFY